MKMMNAALLLIITSSVCAMEAPLTEADHETFRAIPKIMRMCKDIELAVSDGEGNRIVNAPEINGGRSSTSQGLIIEVGIVPFRIFTPWETIDLPGIVIGNSSSRRLKAYAATQQFLEKIQAEFLGFEQKQLNSCDKEWLKYSCISGLSVDEVKKVPVNECEAYLASHKQEITEESVSDFIGKQCFVRSSEHMAFYRVRCVDGKLIPAGHMENDKTGFRYSRDQARKVWKQLQEMNKNK